MSFYRRADELKPGDFLGAFMNAIIIAIQIQNTSVGGMLYNITVMRQDTLKISTNKWDAVFLFEVLYHNDDTETIAP